MKKAKLYQILKDKIMILDGATGTKFQERGMPDGACPEEWILKNPDVLKDMQSKYIESGSDIIYTATLGGNALKLKEYGLDKEAFSINKDLARLSKKIAANKTIYFTSAADR